MFIVIPDKGAKATADPVSSATVKRRSLLTLCFEHKEQNASRFGICAGFRIGARFRSLVRNDVQSRDRKQSGVLNPPQPRRAPRRVGEGEEMAVAGVGVDGVGLGGPGVG